MVVPLVWWTVLLILWSIAAIYLVIQSVLNAYSDIHDKCILIVARKFFQNFQLFQTNFHFFISFNFLVLLLVFYVAAIMSFISMKNAVYRNSSKNQSHSVTYRTNENNELLVQKV